MIDLLLPVLYEDESDQKWLRVTYDPAAPYQLDLHLTDDIVWSVDRGTVVAGFNAPSGYGDVRIWPCRKAVAVRLDGYDGSLLMQFPRSALRDLLDSSYRLVPAGHESRYLDIDDAIDLIYLWESR